MTQQLLAGDIVYWNEMPYTVQNKEWRKLDPANPWVLLEPVDSDLRTKWVPAFECTRIG